MRFLSTRTIAHKIVVVVLIASSLALCTLTAAFMISRRDSRALLKSGWRRWLM